MAAVDEVMNALAAAQRPVVANALMNYESQVEALNDLVAQREASLTEAHAEVDRLRLELAACQEDGPKPPVTPSQVLKLGMSTEWNLWADRLAALGRPVQVRRCFLGSFNVAGIMSRIETCLKDGLLPIASLKFDSTWEAAASGSDDSKFRHLAEALESLDAVVRFTLHHEPRSSNVKTPQALVPWAKANTRAYNVMRDHRPLSKIVLGPIDNGFPWSERGFNKLSDEQLAVYYTPDFVEVCDALGADFYDGETADDEGEPAYVKMRGFAAWTKRIGFTGKLDVGEWNFVDAVDVSPTLEVLKADARWWAASLFNSGANNRPDLPPELGGTWVLKPGSDRLRAFQKMLDDNAQ